MTLSKNSHFLCLYGSSWSLAACSSRKQAHLKALLAPSKVQVGLILTVSEASKQTEGLDGL